METQTPSTHDQRRQAVSSLLSAARVTKARLRWMRGLSAFVRWLPWAVLILIPFAVSYRFGILSANSFALGALAISTTFLLGCLRSGLRGPGLLEAALRLDAAHGLRGRLAAALEYAGAFGSARARGPHDEGYIAIIVADAAQLGEVSAKRAAPLTVPRGTSWALLGAFVLALLLAVPAKTDRPIPKSVASAAPERESQWLMADDAELLQASAAALTESASSEEARQAAAQFNEIVLKSVAGEIDQSEAFRLAAELQADLDGAGRAAEELAQGLEKRGTSLEKRTVTRALGRALSDRNFKEAEEAMKRLSERLASEKEPLSAKELDELRASIEAMRGEVQEKSAEKNASSAQSSDEEHSLKERQKRLLQKQKDGALTDQEKRELAENERQLKRLSRQKKRDDSAQKTLSDLDKQLASAARELEEERKKSGQFMEQAARTLAEGTQKQLTDAEKQELLKQLKALKERLRRQNQDGPQAERLREFERRARGQEGQKPGQKGKPGGAPQPGSGPPRVGPGGAPLPIPDEGPGSEPGDEPGSGKKPGSGHDPNLTAESSRLDGAKHQDTTAVAQDTGQGESASETILSVAERGFTSSSYEQLFREYETVAEEVMEKEAIPVGRKAHVLRYFELIRPRGGGPRAQGNK